ncbi:MAG: hypothetical protein ABH882_06515 [Candidatus Omnitrophota bacterium]|nr:hypothetical protein [Candidatus Omnitrophota bacterium]MBU1928371.1 hypothetical protein [Candidatus Omnitrophota bacterium]MBU2258074.1 hypothetical protein [Candidatus Omnitrophota bacterium]
MEFYFRFFYLATDDINITLSSKKWKIKYCKYNSQGFREDKEFSKSKSNDVFRIGILGDSYIFGQGVKMNDRLSNVLEKLIRDRFKINCEVYNFGKCGWSTLDERNYFFEKGEFYKLDALVLGCPEVDDFMETLGIDMDESNYIDKARIPSNFVVYLLNNSYAFSFFYAQYYKMHCLYSMRNGRFGEKINLVISKNQNWEQYFRYIEEIKNRCESNGIAFYVVSFPITGWSSGKKYRLIMDKFEGFFRSYLDMHNIKYIILNDYLRKYNY